jgi:hypothetical protein
MLQLTQLFSGSEGRARSAPIEIDAEKIRWIAGEGGGARVALTNGADVLVKEAPRTVLRFIEQETALSRGLRACRR